MLAHCQASAPQRYEIIVALLGLRSYTVLTAAEGFFPLNVFLISEECFRTSIPISPSRFIGQNIATCSFFKLGLMWEIGHSTRPTRLTGDFELRWRGKKVIKCKHILWWDSSDIEGRWDTNSKEGPIYPVSLRRKEIESFKFEGYRF